MGLNLKPKRSHVDYVTAWLPAVGSVLGALASWTLFSIMITLIPSTGWPVIPLFLGIGLVFLSIFITVEVCLPRHRLAHRKWGNLNKTSYKSELKALKKNRKRYISYMKGSDREMYYKLVIETEQKIGELTGKGYDLPRNEPKKNAGSRY